MTKKIQTANIPMKTIGPINIKGTCINEKISVPMVTFESPLWPSTQRGARVSMQTDGISAFFVRGSMTRSILLQADSASDITKVIHDLPSKRIELEQATAKTSRFAKLQDWHTQQVGNLLYLRLSFETGDAAGHNMATKAAESIMNWMLDHYPALHYVSISGNFCTDKKASAVNGILGRGKYVVAEMLISREICEKQLRTTPEAVVELNIKKNLIGTALAGGLRSNNAHFANILLAFYLATGQDAANIIEGSQGTTYCEVKQGNLYFSVTLPNLIVGTVGNGKTLDFVKENLDSLGCLAENEPGQNATRLAIICAATVLCGELSLLAAQTNPSELMDSHTRLERIKK